VAYRITFHALAADDLDRIDDFIAQDSPERAIAFVRRIRKHCLSLATMPERGPARDDLAPGVRTLSFERRVTIIYRIEGELVRILRVLYAGQDYPASLQDEPGS